MQAIQTKYIGPTDHKPSRIKAWCEAGSLTMSVNSAEDESGGRVDDAHAYVAHKLAEKLGWTRDKMGHLAGGCLPGNAGYAFVFTGRP